MSYNTVRAIAFEVLESANSNFQPSRSHQNFQDVLKTLKLLRETDTSRRAATHTRATDVTEALFNGKDFENLRLPRGI
jgi:hypothetical protein